ncbi:homogentisate 1,2-dioxygenase [Xylariaceae sp. FL0594]|nr:homogentisate 1,2-dioxygenase [Xylariaceae sp. FL0594]
MTPVTDFAVKDTYEYLNGFNNYHQSEALPGALPVVINTPQKPPYGLRTERISNTSFTAARERNQQTWLYRSVSSMEVGTFTPFTAEDESYDSYVNPAPPVHLTPNSYFWPGPSIPVPVLDIGNNNGDARKGADWITGQKLLGRNGDPQQKQGVAFWLFSVTDDMAASTAFSSLDGETLIVPQAGALDIQTELGRLLVRQNEIVVIPRCVRYRVTLPEREEGKGRATRGYVCELFEGHYQLPNLGAIGSTGLANARDFQIPVAFFEADVVSATESEDGHSNGNGQGVKEKKVVKATRDRAWRIVSRLNGKLWSCVQDHTPFDVVAWHGTTYPYKYDLNRFCALGNTRFDHHDPSLFIVLTAPAYGKAPGTSVLDFAIAPPRWQAARDTLWIPYFHRNVTQEFFFPIISSQSPHHPLNKSGSESAQFKPFACGLHGSMATHGGPEPEFQKATYEKDTSKPEKVDDEGVMLALWETEMPLFLSDWAFDAAVKNVFGLKAKTKL